MDGVVTFAHASLAAPLHFEQRPESIPTDGDADGTFRRIWPASLSFGAHLASCPDLVRGKSVVELGAGSGVAGILCAAFGAEQAWLTDLPAALPLIESNVARNERVATRCTAWPCRWGEDADIAALLEQAGVPAFDVIVASELVYKQRPSTFAALVDTMLALGHETSRVLVVYEFRDELFDDLVFFERMLTHYDVEVIPLRSAGTGAPAAASRADEGECEEFLYVYVPHNVAQS
ncbi:hypothetical protein KFE25_007121 [Diacronema lutheri]|uniref:Calmodulin-lysine N-methyltransferase n=2 Tax=Diacronema lutheri TaxID=2081491 RepID=A0A8J6CCZ3_DIALT|nr:hypothetical protein KFE25_007121 [Diacronema lutheri]